MFQELKTFPLPSPSLGASLYAHKAVTTRQSVGIPPGRWTASLFRVVSNLPSITNIYHHGYWSFLQLKAPRSSLFKRRPHGHCNVSIGFGDTCRNGLNQCSA